MFSNILLYGCTVVYFIYFRGSEKEIWQRTAYDMCAKY